MRIPRSTLLFSILCRPLKVGFGIGTLIKSYKHDTPSDAALLAATGLGENMISPYFNGPPKAVYVVAPVIQPGERPSVFKHTAPITVTVAKGESRFDLPVYALRRLAREVPSGFLEPAELMAKRKVAEKNGSFYTVVVQRKDETTPPPPLQDPIPDYLQPPRDGRVDYVISDRDLVATVTLTDGPGPGEKIADKTFQVTMHFGSGHKQHRLTHVQVGVGKHSLSVIGNEWYNDSRTSRWARRHCIVAKQSACLHSSVFVRFSTKSISLSILAVVFFFC